jgi:hypothetical protein
MAVSRKHEREGERRMAMGRPSYAKDVQEGMSRLGGQSTSKLEPDDRRGAASPLGMGSHSKEKRRGR